MLLPVVLAGVNPYVTAGVAILTALVAATAGLVGGWQVRKGAERAWLRDSRREIFDRFLAAGQALLAACEDAFEPGYFQNPARMEPPSLSPEVRASLANLFAVYPVIQTVAESDVAMAARVYTWRLWELSESLRFRSVIENYDDETFKDVAAAVRTARHDTIQAMRRNLRVGPIDIDDDTFNPSRATHGSRTVS
jgi:hypothetical protein